MASEPHAPPAHIMIANILCCSCSHECLIQKEIRMRQKQKRLLPLRKLQDLALELPRHTTTTLVKQALDDR
eukprot:scaffold313031_cov18-Tisochrysis_lutea.AAC.2